MYYRADKRDFSVDDLIVTAGNFQSLNPNGSDAIEAIFERVRPANKPVRATSLFLFVDERSAKKHWSKMTGGCLYIVEADQSGCIHKGDMRLVDQAFGVRHDQALFLK